MLKNYTISNFKSFMNETTFNLEKTNYQTLASTNVNNNILKGLMFIGSNASGKTNSVVAIKFLLDCLFGNNDTSYVPYKCLFNSNPTIKLSYTFEIEKKEIKYDIKLQTLDESIFEDLYIDNTSVFHRDCSYASVNINEHLEYSDVPKKSLFLRSVYFNTKFRGNSTLQKWFEFLSNSVYVDLYERQITTYKDTNLTINSYLETYGTDKINDFFKEFNFGQEIEYGQKVTGKAFSIEATEKTIFYVRDNIGAPIPYQYESLGNKNLIQLLPALFHCINNNGILILDEFSSGFHNDLEELLIKYFMKHSTNSQIIFVSHSTNLLSTSLLRPDQIYSVDFDENGSRIKRFSSEKPREAQNIEKMYLSGIFDGVPKYENIT